MDPALRKSRLFVGLLGLAVIGLAATALRAGDPPKAGGEKKPPKKQADMTDLPPDVTAEEADLKKLGEGFKLVRTKHFSILTNAGEKDAKAFSIAIERTYRSNVNYTLSLGIEPRTPNHKLLIYFFKEHRQYDDYSKSLGKGERPQTQPGVFFPDLQRSMFYDFQNHDTFRKAREDAEAQIKRLREQLQNTVAPAQRKNINEQIQKARAIANSASTRGGGQNEETVQHEVTHHVFWNIGLHNSKSFVANPRWFVEGTAMMFETSAKGKSSNIGAVNKGRLLDYQHLQKAGKLFPLEDLVRRPEAVFMSGGEAPYIFYAQSWAVVHYLNRTKRDRIRGYVEEINRRPANYESDPDAELEAFERAFGKLDSRWVRAWKDWMKSVR